MAQANSFQHVSIMAVKVLARLSAKRLVQAQLRDQGVRVTLFPHAELMRLAGEYLANHPELYVAAHERARRMTAEGVFGKRAQRALLANISNSAQSKAPCSTEKISVRKLGAM
jgi:hypothetical protein